MEMLMMVLMEMQLAKIIVLPPTADARIERRR